MTSSNDPSTDATIRWEAGHHKLHGQACLSHQQTQPTKQSDAHEMSLANIRNDEMTNRTVFLNEGKKPKDG